MKSPSMKTLAIGSVIAGMSASAVAQTPEESRLAELENQVAELRQEQQNEWLTERRKAEVKGLVREVLADAETRASLLESGMHAGHDGKHFFLKSADGGFLMNIAGQIQFRHIANFRDEEDGSSSLDEQETGFEIRRTKLEFSGHIADPRIKYAIQLTVSSSSNNVSSDKIVIGYQLTDSLYVWGGEDKAPFLREELTSSKRQLTVDRSYVNELFTVDKAQGIGLTWYDPSVMDDMLKVAVMINDGMKSGDGSTSVNRFTQRNDFDAQDSDRSTNKTFDDDATDFAISGRVDLRITGDWKQMKDFTSWPGEDHAVFVGAAVHHETGETGDTFLNNNFTSWTLDASWEYNGWNVYGAVIGLHTDNEATSTRPNMDHDLYGFLVQAGYNMPVGDDSLEPFVRYEYIDFDDALPRGGSPGDELDELSIITLGVNYYFTKHNAKFTFDLVYALDTVPIGSSGLGILADADGEDDQVVLRTQFQLLF